MILILSVFCQPIEKVGSCFQYHADDVLGFTPNFGAARRGNGISIALARLIPAYGGFGVIRLSVQPSRFTFVQSRARFMLSLVLHPKPMPQAANRQECALRRLSS